MKFVNFVKSRLVFNLIYSFWMFVNKLFTISHAHISKSKGCFNLEIFTILFSYEDEDIGRFSNLRWCTFNFPWNCPTVEIYIICGVLHKSSIWERSCSWDIGRNDLSHSDCRIFKSTTFPEQIDETALFFAWWCKFIKIKRLSKIF